MSKIFILDDMDERHVGFRKKFEGHELVNTYEVQDAVRELASNDFDYIYLDHDLGFQIYTESNENSGYEVAKWIANNYTDKKVRIIIHSWNVAGARKMGTLLFENGFKYVLLIPFPCNGYGPTPINDKRMAR